MLKLKSFQILGPTPSFRDNHNFAKRRISSKILCPCTYIVLSYAINVNDEFRQRFSHKNSRQKSVVSIIKNEWKNQFKNFLNS
jgi:hypothetical protein